MSLNVLINVEELNALLGQSNVMILDCRFYLTDHEKGQKEYDKGHIPGALFVDVHHELASSETELTGRHPLPSSEVFARTVQQWGVSPETQVIVYDDAGGGIAARAWWMLAQQGIDVRVLNGGIPAWIREGFALSVEPEKKKAVSYLFPVSFPWAVSEERVVENFETGAFQLMDARASTRFHGENETIDPVAGHIPGAVNRPYSENLDEDGCFKPLELLRKEWEALLPEDITVVHYCGSGITACHNALALHSIGVENRQVYVGSWSQWAKRMLRAASSVL